MWFEAILGLKINLTKSELILVGRTENLDELGLVLGCKVGVLPTTYLGLPLGAPFNSLVAWDGVEERFHKRLVLWKIQYISKGGKLTLIRSTLSNFANLLFVSFPDAKDCGVKVGKNPKGLPMGRCDLR